MALKELWDSYSYKKERAKRGVESMIQAYKQEKLQRYYALYLIWLYLYLHAWLHHSFHIISGLCLWFSFVENLKRPDQKYVLLQQKHRKHYHDRDRLACPTKTLTKNNFSSLLISRRMYFQKKINMRQSTNGSSLNQQM